MTQFVYRVVNENEISDELLKECSDLFSNNYGKWSLQANEKLKEKQIKLSALKLKENYLLNQNPILVTVRNQNILIGHIIAIQCNIPNFGPIIWITQCVVSTLHRRNGVATSMMKILLENTKLHHQCKLCGVCTANPFTIRALESAIGQRFQLNENVKHEQEISFVLRKIPFFKNCEMVIDQKRNFIKPNFHVQQDLKLKIAKCSETFPWQMEEIEHGDEWIVCFPISK